LRLYEGSTAARVVYVLLCVAISLRRCADFSQDAFCDEWATFAFLRHSTVLSLRPCFDEIGIFLEALFALLSVFGAFIARADALKSAQKYQKDTFRTAMLS